VVGAAGLRVEKKINLESGSGMTASGPVAGALRKNLWQHYTLSPLPKRQSRAKAGEKMG
jgi:hypothetical protein